MPDELVLAAARPSYVADPQGENGAALRRGQDRCTKSLAQDLIARRGYNRAAMALATECADHPGPAEQRAPYGSSAAAR